MIAVDSVSFAKVKLIFGDDFDQCWRWTGPVNSAGYGSHRTIWKWFYPIDITGQDLDHYLYPDACIGKLCVNPFHLRPASRRENILRSDGFASQEAAQTHCVKGHEFTPENTHVRSGNKTKRDCKTCRREYDRSRYSDPKRRAAMREANRRSSQRRRAGDAT